MQKLTTASYAKIGLIVLLAVLICLAAGFSSCSGLPFGQFGQNRHLSEIGNASIPASDVDSLEINWAAGEVEIKTHKGDSEIKITESSTGNINRARAMEWEVRGGKLVINYGNGNLISCSPLTGLKHLEVSIPESLAKDMETVAINGASGKYSVDDIDCKTLTVSLASGEIKAKSVVLDELQIDVASGTAFVEGEISKRISLSAASGKMEVISHKVCPAAIDTSVVSGMVTVAVPENDGFTLEVSKVSGSWNSEFDMKRNEDNVYTYKNGKATFNADMVSGTFNLKKSS